MKDIHNYELFSLRKIMKLSLNYQNKGGNICLFVCVKRPIDSEVIQRRHPHLLSLAKDVKLGKYTVPTGNRTRGRRVAVHYVTAAPRTLHGNICKRN